MYETQKYNAWGCASLFVRDCLTLSGSREAPYERNHTSESHLPFPIPAKPQCALEYGKKHSLQHLYVLRLSKNRGKGGAVRMVSCRSSALCFSWPRFLSRLCSLPLRLPSPP